MKHLRYQNPHALASKAKSSKGFSPTVFYFFSCIPVEEFT
jgi:hypothetical protein